jgi:hypothetical protein
MCYPDLDFYVVGMKSECSLRVPPTPAINDRIQFSLSLSPVAKDVIRDIDPFLWLANALHILSHVESVVGYVAGKIISQS